VELQEAFHAKKAPMELCHWRLDRRAGRPKRELKRENFEIALDQEKEVLTDSMQRIQDSIRRTDSMIRKLVETRAELLDDLKHKSHALSIDDDCINAQHTWGAGQGAHAALELPANAEHSKLPIAMMYGSRHEEQEHSRQYDTVNRCKRAKKREQVAQELRDDSAKVMKTTYSACQTAHIHVQKQMQVNIDELQHMRKRLTNGIEQSNAKISHLQNTIVQTANEIASHNAPFNLAKTRLNLRGQRPGRENISDPVRDALDQQMASLDKNMEDLETRQQHEKQALGKLQQDKAALEADLADKSRALQIDLECQKKSSDLMSSHQSAHEGKRAVAGMLKQLGVATYPMSQSARGGFPTSSNAKKGSWAHGTDAHNVAKSALSGSLGRAGKGSLTSR